MHFDLIRVFVECFVIFSPVRSDNYANDCVGGELSR